MKLNQLIVFWLLLASAASAQTNQAWSIFRYPERMFAGNAVVNLMPLFAWWARQPLVVTNQNAGSTSDANGSPEEARPLSSWYRITGTPMATTGSSWLMDAVVYTSPTRHTNSVILLNNPPVGEVALFNALKAQLAEARQRIADARRVYDANTNAEAKALAEVAMYRRSWSKVASDGVIAYTRVAMQKHNDSATALNQLDQLEAARRQIEAQLETIPSRNGVYQVDLFAMLLGRNKQGVPTYDLGLVNDTPP